MAAMTKAAVEVTAPTDGASYSVLDTVFFVVGGIAAVWLTSLLVQLSFQWGWAQVCDAGLQPADRVLNSPAPQLSGGTVLASQGWRRS